MLTVLLWIVVASVLGSLNADPDLWGHLRFGQDALRDLRLPAADPYSFTQDVPWINHEWLSELQMAIAYRFGGVGGLMVLKFLVLGVACAVLAWMLRRLPLALRAIAVVLVMWAAAPLATMMRPQMWSFACTAIVAAMLTSEKPSARLLWLPVVFAFWVNLHGGWIVGGLLVVVWAAVRLPDPAWRRWALVVSVLSVAATLVNPYGLQMWLFLLRTVRIGRDARDWQPLSVAPFRDWWPWLLTCGAAFGLAAARYRLRAQRTLTIAIMACLSFRVVRLIPFFVLITAIYLAPALFELARRHPRLCWRPLAPSRGAAVLLLIPSVVVTAMSLSSASRPLCIRIEGDWVPDALTARALQRARPHGKLVTEFGWGEYAIWHFGPALRPSMDGRRETVYSDAMLHLYDNVLAGDPASVRFVTDERVDYVWLTPKRDRLRAWVTENGYRIDLTVPGSAWLAVRDDLPPVLPPVDVPSDAAPVCFPG